jgi:hypothetical protein
MRPPHTLAEQRRLLADPRAQNRPDFRNLAVGHPVGQLRDNPNGPLKVQSVSMSQKVAIQQSAKQVSSFKNERLQLETKGGSGNLGRAAGAAGTGPASPEKVSFSKLPSFQAADTKTGSPASSARPAQRAAPRPKGTPSGQARQGAKPAGRDARSDQPRGERDSRPGTEGGRAR